MKRRIFAIIVLGVMLLGLAGCQKASLEDHKLFRSTPLGFSVEYPEFWKKSVSTEDGAAVFVSPAEGYSDQYTESLSVQRFEPDMEFNEYVKGYVEDLEGSVSNYKLVSESETTLGGEKAYQIEYESTSNDGKSEMRFRQIFVEHGDYFYVVTYMGEFSSYSYFLTYVEKMLTTFTFLK